eukprot:954349-Rhodomonas_salina.2
MGAVLSSGVYTGRSLCVMTLHTPHTDTAHCKHANTIHTHQALPTISAAHTPLSPLYRLSSLISLLALSQQQYPVLSISSLSLSTLSILSPPHLLPPPSLVRPAHFKYETLSFPLSLSLYLFLTRAPISEHCAHYLSPAHTLLADKHSPCACVWEDGRSRSAEEMERRMEEEEEGKGAAARLIDRTWIESVGEGLRQGREKEREGDRTRRERAERGNREQREKKKKRGEEQESRGENRGGRQREARRRERGGGRERERERERSQTCHGKRSGCRRCRTGRAGSPSPPPSPAPTHANSNVRVRHNTRQVSRASPLSFCCAVACSQLLHESLVADRRRGIKCGMEAVRIERVRAAHKASENNAASCGASAAENECLDHAVRIRQNLKRGSDDWSVEIR